MFSHKNLIHTLEKRFTTDPKLIQVLLGPRQVGKTTAIKTFLKSYKGQWAYYSAEKNFTADNLWLERIWFETCQKNPKALLVIDEIQKIPNWQETVKKLWDEQSFEKKSKLKILLTGSSSLNINRGLSESLTGRFELIKAFHWSFEESKKLHKMNLEEYQKIGGYPGSYKLLKSKKRWEDYLNESIINTVVNKDILLHNRVKSPSLFKQAFSLICSYPAQEISYNKLLGQIQDKGNIDQIKYYIELFEEAYLIKSIFKYSTSEIRKKSSSPKIIPLCPALINRSILHRDEIEGRLFETVVGNDLVRAELPIFYWREGDAEVDYIVELGGKIFAIEVKSGRIKSAKGLKLFMEKFPKSKPVFLTRKNYESFKKSPLEFLKSL